MMGKFKLKTSLYTRDRIEELYIYKGFTIQLIHFGFVFPKKILWNNYIDIEINSIGLFEGFGYIVDYTESNTIMSRRSNKVRCKGDIELQQIMSNNKMWIQKRCKIMYTMSHGL